MAVGGNLAARVVRERRRLGWKQFALAYEAGVTERTIQRLERGEKVNEDTIRKVMGALKLSQQKRPRAGRGTSRRQSWYSSVADAASGLHGQPLGFGRFLRRLPGDVLQRACFDGKLQALITLHAILIVDGNPDAGIEQERAIESVYTIRMQMIFEHLRRIALVRVRYPRDPFSDVPEIAWWMSHPFVKALFALPLEIRDKTMSLILQTGDVTVLAGHAMAMPDAEAEEFLRRVEEIDSHNAELLEWMEAEYGDSQKLAWSEPAPATADADFS